MLSRCFAPFLSIAVFSSFPSLSIGRNAENILNHRDGEFTFKYNLLRQSHYLDACVFANEISRHILAAYATLDELCSLFRCEIYLFVCIRM